MIHWHVRNIFLLLCNLVNLWKKLHCVLCKASTAAGDQLSPPTQSTHS